MEEAVAVRSFPWSRLPKFARDDVVAARELRRAVQGVVDAERLAEALGELVGQRSSLLDIRFGIDDEVPSERVVSLGFQAEHGALRFGVDLERDFVAAVVSSVLGRPTPLVNPDASIDPSLAGAAAAVVARVARRCCGGPLLEPLGLGALTRRIGERRGFVSATIRLGEDTFRVRVTITLNALLPPTPRPPRAALLSLGDLPLTLPVVAATAASSAADLSLLGAGDVWLPGTGWMVERQENGLRGRVILVPPAHEWGINGSLTDRPGIMLGTISRSRLDQELPMDSITPNAEPADDHVAEVVLEAPVVVRVEVASVTLTAREWGTLAPGDVLPLRRPLGDEVILRAGGVEIAHGDLVDVNGELGVRIREIVGAQ